MRGWQSYLFDSELFQRHDLNQVRDAEQALEGDVTALALEVGRLRAELRELSVTNAIALRMLADAGHLDVAALRARVTAELAIPEVVGGGKLMTCIKCGKRLPPSKLDLTDDGPVCDFCR